MFDDDPYIDKGMYYLNNVIVRFQVSDYSLEYLLLEMLIS